VELVGSLPSLIDSQAWQTLQNGARDVVVGESRLRVAETVLRSGDGYRVLWHWYAVAGSDVASDWRAKLLEAWTVLRYGRSDVVLVLLSAGAEEVDDARGALAGFGQNGGTALRGCLHGPVCRQAP
jgi:EpsI family protein